MTTEGPRVRIRLVGAFAIHNSAGEDRTPRGRKACAIIAMLALAPDGARTRSWLQDKLWSTRGPEQGAGSLRQSLHELRAALGADRDLIIADKFNVALDRSKYITDLEDDTPRATRSDVELLEGLDIGDDQFEDWLREQRSSFDRERSNVKSGTAADAAPSPTTRAVEQRQLLILTRAPAEQSEAAIITNSLLDAVAKSVVELGVADVYDRPANSERSAHSDDEIRLHGALSLQSEFFSSEAKKIVRLALLQVPQNSLAWSSTLQLSSKQANDIDDPAVRTCINLIVNVAVDQFSKINGSESDQSLASALCRSGITHLFRLGKVNIETADSLFARAFEIEPRGIYLAWRAYLRTFLLVERHGTNRETIEAEAFDFMHRALAMEPYNSYVAALSAHVQSITRRSDAAAYELAERAIQLNRANPLGWAVIGVAETYLGRVGEGLRHTLLARKIAGHAPYRYQLDAFSFIASTVFGDVEQAIQLAEACHAIAPDFKPPLRYLSGLYAYQGMHERSFEMVQKLQLNEPDFTLDRLRDKGYPAWALHRTPIIAGLPRRQV